MLEKILNIAHKKKQISLLKNHKNARFGSLKIGYNNHFTVYQDAKLISIGNNVNFRNYIHIIIQNNAQLLIGDNVFLNNLCSLNVLEYVEIGENTLFGEGVRIYDHNHQYTRSDNKLLVEHQKFSTAPVKIGKNCWLGSNVTVLKGVDIGDNCIVGAGCTIYKDIPANTTIINQQNLIQI